MNDIDRRLASARALLVSKLYSLIDSLASRVHALDQAALRFIR